MGKSDGCSLVFFSVYGKSMSAIVSQSPENFKTILSTESIDSDAYLETFLHSSVELKMARTYSSPEKTLHG